MIWGVRCSADAAWPTLPQVAHVPREHQLRGEQMEVKSSAYEVEKGDDWGKVETKKLKRDGEMTEP